MKSPKKKVKKSKAAQSNQKKVMHHLSLCSHLWLYHRNQSTGLTHQSPAVMKMTLAADYLILITLNMEGGKGPSYFRNNLIDSICERLGDYLYIREPYMVMCIMILLIIVMYTTFIGHKNPWQFHNIITRWNSAYIHNIIINSFHKVLMWNSLLFN